MSFTEQDHARLGEAMALVKDVADRHPSGDLRVISFLCSALQDVRMAELVDSSTAAKQSVASEPQAPPRFSNGTERGAA